MSNVEILEKTPMSIPLVREALKRIKKRDEELTFRGTRTEEYVNEVSKLKAKEAKELTEKLVALDLPRLKEDHIHKIVDILPQHEKQLRVILQGYTITVSMDNMKKIMKVVQEFTKK